MAGTLSARDFVNKWRGKIGTERALSQSHFNDVCALDWATIEPSMQPQKFETFPFPWAPGVV